MLKLPTSRRRPAILSATWRNILLFSWPVPDETVQNLTPDGLEIDRWNGDAYVSLVGLRFEKVNLFGIPAPARSYDEINLRFYVRRKFHDVDRQPGVVFVRQLVPHRVTARVARMLYGEPFEVATVGHAYNAGLSGNESPARRVEYWWENREGSHRMWAETNLTPQQAPPGSLDEFLTERYWGYNGKPGLGTRAYRLVRPVWDVARATTARVECAPDGVDDTGLGGIMRSEPASVLLACGSWAQIGLPSALNSRSEGSESKSC